MYLVTAMAACEITVLKGKIVSLSIVMGKGIIGGGGEMENKNVNISALNLWI